MDSLYIANAVAARVRFEFLLNSSTLDNIVGTIGGLFGLNTAIMRADLVYLAVMLAAVALEGLISWKGINIASAYASTIGAGRAMKRLPKRPKIK